MTHLFSPSHTNLTNFSQEYAAVLHALAGNLVELIISSFALMDGHYAVVRSALLGAILSNILLVRLYLENCTCILEIT